MALFEALIKSKSFIDLLGDDLLSTLRCPVCMEYFNEPVVLVCGHTFCYECLHDMSRHMKSKMMNIHIRNMRINCPNCRISVHVQTVMQRKITTNYTVASFLESLKEIQVPVKTYSDASTNTEVEDNSKDVEEEEEDKAYEYDEQKLNEIRDELDFIFSGLNVKSSVIDDAWQEIDKLRQYVNDSSDQQSLLGETETNMKTCAGKRQKKEDEKGQINENVYSQAAATKINDSLSREDPAIIMSAVGVVHKQI